MDNKSRESLQQENQRDIGEDGSCGNVEFIWGGAPVTVNATNGAIVNATFVTKRGRETSAPTMEALKELIDAVITTTKDESTAERLEICRSYLFNPLLGSKLDRLMFASVKGIGGVPGITAGR